jgi:hypothetical protein
VASFTGSLLDGLAHHLATAGIGLYQPGTAYRDSDTGITLAAMPDTPTRVVVLTAYGDSDDPSLSDSEIRVQVRCRAGTDPREVHTLADQVFDLLHGACSYNLGTVRVVQSYRTSSAPLGMDTHYRHEHSDNYRLTVWRPSPHRL